MIDRRLRIAGLRRARRVFALWVAGLLVASVAIMVPGAAPDAAAQAGGEVPAPTGVVAMVDSDHNLQIRWDSLSPNDPDFFALRWKAVDENTSFQRVYADALVDLDNNRPPYGTPVDGKHQYSVPGTETTVWESAGIKTGETWQDISSLSSVTVTDGLPVDVEMTSSPAGLNISWENNPAVDDNVLRTVIFHRAAGSPDAWTFVNLTDLGITESDGRFEVDVAGIDEGQEVEMRIVYSNLGKTKRSDLFFPTPAPLGPIGVQVQDGWDLSFVHQANTDDGGRAILVVGNTVYVGGDFVGATNDDGSQTASRTYLAAFDRTTGELTGFNPTITGPAWAVVNALAISDDGQTLFVGGAFDAVNGVSRKNFAAFDIGNDGALTSLDIQANKAIRAMVVDGSQLYVGGSFTRIDGQDRERLARIDLTGETGQLSAGWQPTADADVKAMAIDHNGRIWIGGDFTQLSGNGSAKHIAAVNADTGVIEQDPIDPVSRSTAKNPLGKEVEIIALAASGNQVFAAGGGPGGTGFAYNADDGSQQWRVFSDGNYQGVAAIGNYVYLGGHYDRLWEVAGDGTKADRLSRYRIGDGEWDAGWNPDIGGIRGVNAIAAEDDGVYIAGQFHSVETISGATQKGWAHFFGSPG